MGARKARSVQQADAEVGERIRVRRKQLGLTQRNLAGALEISTQQLQKYERGKNRVGVGRLQQIAWHLDVPIAALFPQIAGPYDNTAEEALVRSEIAYFVSSPEGIELNECFARIFDENLRHNIVNFVKALGKRNPLAAVSDL